jgi:hypothetical protein
LFSVPYDADQLIPNSLGSSLNPINVHDFGIQRSVSELMELYDSNIGSIKGLDGSNHNPEQTTNHVRSQMEGNFGGAFEEVGTFIQPPHLFLHEDLVPVQTGQINRQDMRFGTGFNIGPMGYADPFQREAGLGNWY